MCLRVWGTAQFCNTKAHHIFRGKGTIVTSRIWHQLLGNLIVVGQLEKCTSAHSSDVKGKGKTGKGKGEKEKRERRKEKRRKVKKRKRRTIDCLGIEMLLLVLLSQ